MAIFTRRFANSCEYEEWLGEAGGRIHVLSVTNSPVLFGSTALPQSGPVILRYQAHDQSFAPPRSMTGKFAEAAILGTAFLIVFLYVISKI